MSVVSAKVAERLSTGLRRFQTILANARQRDINEADTVTIVKDMLADVWGFDKYSEVTAEHAIRGTFCDLAVLVGGEMALLIEVKAVGIDLKAGHTRQAVDYTANRGIDWIARTNGWCWHLYRMTFTKPIEAERVVEFDVTELDPKRPADLDTLYVLSCEGMQKSALEEYHTQRQATDRFLLAAAILSDPVLQVIRRELRRLNADVRIGVDEVRAVLAADVLKREVVDGEKSAEALARVQKAGQTRLRARKGSARLEAETDDAPQADAPPELPRNALLSGPPPVGSD